MRLTLKNAGPSTAFGCELVGLLALWLTPDVPKTFFLLPALIAVAAWIFRFSLRDRPLLLLVALCVLGGYLTAGASPTGTLLARAIIPVHALLWLAKNETLYRYWRLSVALLELVLAAILAPEAHMFILIFLFVVVSSLSLSFAFLERNFGRDDPGALERPLRASFVGAVLALSFVIFLSSLLIFPLLPRSRWGEGSTTVGYTETVNLRQSILSWASRDSRPAIWIFRPHDGIAWEKIVPFYLLRGQVLEEFRMDIWRSAGRFPSATQFPAGEKVEIIRQPLPAEILPVPYGAGKVKAHAHLGAIRFESAEWLAPDSRSQRVKYEVDVGVFQRGYLGEGPAKPDAASLRFSAKLFPGIVKLSQDLSRGAASDDERLSRVREHFRGFTYELGSMAGAEEGKKHPVEVFLFDRKAGHCELFASAAALIFRAMGMPSRLVAGFRVSPPSRGNVLTVHSSDAHAWVEVFIRGKGWVPVDLTPVLYERGWVREAFGDIYDSIGAYWALYILEYEYSFELPAHWPRMLGALVSSIILGFGIHLYRRRRGSGLTPRGRLPAVYLELEDDLIYRAGLYPDTAFRDLPEAREWKREYMNLRFGRREPTREDFRRIRHMAKHVLSRAVPAPKSGA